MRIGGTYSEKSMSFDIVSVLYCVGVDNFKYCFNRIMIVYVCICWKL